MKGVLLLLLAGGLTALLPGSLQATGATASDSLPPAVVFKGADKFEALKSRAISENWSALPIGQRVATAGRALVGSPYKSSTLEIDRHIEAPSVNLNGFDCWTFFETSLALARMTSEPREQWTPETLRRYVELDRYRNGHCTGSYLSRLHYLEDWLGDNASRNLISDLTRQLGGVRVPHAANEMTLNWRSYPYMVADPSLRSGIRTMEERVADTPLYHIPKSKVPAVEDQMQSGDIIGITSRDRGGIGTSHVGLAYRTSDGVLHFMHASSPSNHGAVVVDTRLSDYLNHFRSDAGILIARPLK